jgi:pyruvate dehydrogenase E1 component
MGATAGRTTLQGEGLQHDDGHSHLLALAHPSCRAYDPAFAYEVAVIVRDGIRRMYGDNAEDVFYYVTLYNENYLRPPMPDGVEDGITAGLYLFRPAEQPGRHRAQIFASGTAMLAALEAQQVLAEQHGVAADVWSATSWKALSEDALETERWNRLHPTEAARRPYVARALAAAEAQGPVVAVTEYMKALPLLVAPFLDRPFTALGTDGFGFSDTRPSLRRHFEVDAPHVVVAVLEGLARQGSVSAEAVAKAIARCDIDTEAADPRRR